MKERAEIVIEKRHEHHFIGLVYLNNVTPEVQVTGNLNEVIEKLKEWEDYIINYLD